MVPLQNLFPVHLKSDWLAQTPAHISPRLNDWLYDPASLTARLKSQYQRVEVVVLGEHIIPCPADEACDEVQTNEEVLAREVVLFCDDKPEVFARSLLPLRSLTGEQQALTQLGNKPLGQVIFNNPSLQRKLIQVAEFTVDSGVAKLAEQIGLPLQHNLWGRRSLFFLEGKPLVVAEVFLPNAKAYQ